MEKEIQDYKNKLLQEEQKRKELEEKNKKLEQEKNSNNSSGERVEPIINNTNVTNVNINNNDNKDLNETQNQNMFLKSITNNRVNEVEKEIKNHENKEIQSSKTNFKESINKFLNVEKKGNIAELNQNVKDSQIIQNV